MSQKALFLDRDGVINVDKGYIYQPEQVEWVQGIHETIKHYQSANYLIVVVTNQSGIARGMYTEADFNDLMDWMNASMDKYNIHLDGIYYCPHHPTAGKGEYKQKCTCRKPAAGMFEQAITDHQIDVKASVMIGDSWRDVLAAESVNVGTIFYLNQQMTDEQLNFQQHSASQIKQIKSLSEARLLN